MSAGLELTHSVRDELLEFGLLVVFASPLRNTTMIKVVQEVSGNATTPFGLNVIHRVQTKLHSLGNAFGQSTQSTETAIGMLNIFLGALGAEGDVRTAAKDLSAIWLAIGGFFVSLRLISKAYIVKNMRLDDWLILLAWLGAMTYEAFGAFAGGNSTRQCFHTWNATRNELETRMWWTFISEIFFVIVTYLIKIAVVAFYWYIVPCNSSSAKFSFFHKSIIGVVVFGTMLFISSLFVVVFQCTPVNFWLDPAGAKCMPRLPVWIGLNAFVFVIDIFILILPIRVVWRLNMAHREKVIVTCLFLLGSISVCIGIPRVVLVAIYMSSADFTFSSCANNIWVQAEFNLAIVAVCVPATRTLAMRYAPKLLTGSCHILCPSSRTNIGGSRGRPKDHAAARAGLEGSTIKESKRGKSSQLTSSADSEV